MILKNFFSEYKPKSINAYLTKEKRLGGLVDFLSKKSEFNLSEYDLAIFGIAEYRNANFNSSTDGINEIRSELYQLNLIDKNIKIIDLGNFISGKTLKDSYAGLEQVVEILTENKVIPLIIGGSQDLSYPIVNVLKKSENDLNFATVDSKINYIPLDKELMNCDSFLNEILNSNEYIQYANIGTQKYLNDIETLEFIKFKHFENYRLGQIRNNIMEIEPVLRDCEFLSVDISALKYSESPGQVDPSPNGLNNDEFCQIARYAGLGNKMKAVGLFNYYSEKDERQISSKGLAQFIWHFIEGFHDKNKIFSRNEWSDLKKYIITIESSDHKIEFYNNVYTGHWWFTVPTKSNQIEKRVACSANDYKIALNNQLPDRWWLFFQKLNF